VKVPPRWRRRPRRPSFGHRSVDRETKPVFRALLREGNGPPTRPSPWGTLFAPSFTPCQAHRKCSSFRQPMAVRTDRRYRRRKLNRSQAILTDVVLPHGGASGTASGAMTVIGRGGAFIETSAESRQGSTVFLSFALPPGRVRCTGIVRDCAREGVGIEFTEVADTDADRINAFVELAGPGGDNPPDQRRIHHGERKMQEESPATIATPGVRTSGSATSDAAKTPTRKKEEDDSGAIITAVNYDTTPVVRPAPAPTGPGKSSVERPRAQTQPEERAGQTKEFELQLFGTLNNNIRRTAKFTGSLLASGSGSQVDGDRAEYILFFTRGANLVVHAKSLQGATVEVFRRFDDFKDAIESREDGEYRLAFGNVLPAVAKIMGADYTLWID
jgi:hypothetical protein